jgi:glycosyltransferase involved in cell wall biosynthesis
MRILLCNYEYPPLGGGGGVISKHLAEDLAERHEVTVITSQGPGTPAEAIENGVRVIRVPVFARRQKSTANIVSMFAYIPMAIQAGKRLMKTEKFDVINTHFALPTGPAGDALAKYGNIPNILTLLGGDIYDPSKITSPHRHYLLRAWVRRILRNADVVIGDSQDIVDNMNRYFTMDVEGIRIPLAIQRPVFTPATREKFGFADDEILLATVGRLVGRKAIDQLIASVQALGNDKVRLVVIGSGPLDETLKEEARKRGVDDKVRFMGFVEEEEKFQLLEMSDIYVSTSQHEGFGLVFLEGMHCGLPVVCYDRGGQIDFLTNDETGYVVKLNDLDQFTARCRELIESSDKRKAMGDHNRELVKEYYVDVMTRHYEDIFQEAIAARSSRGAAVVAR